MRIGQLLTSLSWRGGGVSELARGMSLALSRRGVAVEVFGVQDAATDDALEAWHPLQPRLTRRVGPAPLAWAPGQLRALLDARLDALHVHGLWTSQSWRALRWAQESASPYVVSPHGMLDAWALRRSGAAKRLAGWLFETRHLKRAACLHALCEAESAAIRAHGYRGAICEIPPAVEPASDASAPVTPTWRAAVDAGRSVLLYLGRLHPKKGLPALVAGWAEARRQSRPLTEPWQLVLAGWDQGSHAADLVDLARANGVADSVSFLGPALGSERAAAYRAARAFVLPSLSEGLPLTILEAWAHGLPVLMTAACHLPEGFEAQAALPLPDSSSMAPALLKMLGLSDAERKAMGARGRLLVARRFSWEVVGPQLLALYAWLTGAGPAPETVVGNK